MLIHKPGLLSVKLCYWFLICGALSNNFFNSTAFQGWVFLQRAQLSHAMKGGMEGCVGKSTRKKGSVASV